MGGRPRLIASLLGPFLFGRSLFGRMVLLLVGGLVLAQGLGILIHHWDRERVFGHASAIQAAQRTAEIISVLDGLESAGRANVATILNTRRWSVLLAEPPAQSFTQAQVPVNARADAAQSEFARTLAPLLSGREYQLGTNDNAYVVAARLNGGEWVSLSFRRDLPIAPDRLLWTWLMLGAAIVIVTLIATRWITRPLSVLASAAEALGRDINRPPLAEGGPSEVNRAARAFNTMQARLQRFIDDRNRIFVAMSHDLKTPITRLRLRAELLEDAQLQAKFIADLEQMDAMASESLAFMRGMQDSEASRPIDVAALLESIQADAVEMGHAVALVGCAGRPYSGKPQALRRALSNLVNNAAQYGQRAEIVVDDNRERLLIRIRDTGPGIPEALLEQVFEPFYRLEASRSRASGGSGLGLSIARNIARLHGGDIVLRNRPEGGLEASVSLPRGSSETLANVADAGCNQPHRLHHWWDRWKNGAIEKTQK